MVSPAWNAETFQNAQYNCIANYKKWNNNNNKNCRDSDNGNHNTHTHTYAHKQNTRTHSLAVNKVKGKIASWERCVESQYTVITVMCCYHLSHACQCMTYISDNNACRMHSLHNNALCVRTVIRWFLVLWPKNVARVQNICCVFLYGWSGSYASLVYCRLYFTLTSYSHTWSVAQKGTKTTKKQQLGTWVFALILITHILSFFLLWSLSNSIFVVLANCNWLYLKLF